MLQKVGIYIGKKQDNRNKKIFNRTAKKNEVRKRSGNVYRNLQGNHR